MSTSRRSIGSSFLVLVGAAFGVLGTRTDAGAAAPPRPALVGTVTSDSGKPVRGAMILIRTAAPREGTSATCPSCYLDCGKKAVTDGRGRFEIASVDPKLTFNVLVLAKGFKAKLLSRVDATVGPQSVALTPFDLRSVDPEKLVRGSVTDSRGRPVVGAIVEVRGVRRGSSTRFGSNHGVDPVAVTDARGEFALVTSERVDEVLVAIEGRGLAKRSASFAAATVRLPDGVTVTGRVVDGGKPVPGVTIGMVQTSRESSQFLGAYQVDTDGDGRFRFFDMPPGQDMFIYGQMQSFPERRGLAMKTVTLGDDGSTLDVGDLAVTATRRVAGRLVFSDGSPVPPGTRLGLSREDAWDLVEVIVAADGSFVFPAVPEESVTLSARVKGYRFSDHNPSRDWRHFGIGGRVDRDIDDLTLVMEPGDRPSSFSSTMKPPPGVEPNPRKRPLRGAKWPPAPAAAGASAPKETAGGSTGATESKPAASAKSSGTVPTPPGAVERSRAP